MQEICLNERIPPATMCFHLYFYYSHVLLVSASFNLLVLILHIPIIDTPPAFVAATTASIIPLVPDSNLAISNTPMGLQNRKLNFQ